MTRLLALVAVAGLAAAAPAPVGDIVGRSTFTVNQIAKGKYFKSGPMAMMKTYNKYAAAGASAPADVVSAAAAASQSGTVTATPEQYDESYLCPVQVGANSLMLDFDTGSADLWVFSKSLPSSESTGHTLYQEGGTLKSGYTWDITYGDGSGAKGIVYADKVVIGGVTATSQAVEAATSVSSSFTSDTDNDGLVGLAFSSINTVEPQAQTTFFDTVKSTLAKKLFTSYLKKGQAGSYDFGFINSAKYKGAITYVPVSTANGFWEFTATGVSGSSIMDTGTTLLYLPSSNVKAYYKKVSGASYSSSEGGYVFPCSTTPPAYTVTIGGTVFTVPGSYINFAPVDSTGKTCFGGIQLNTGIGFSIFGDIFIKSQFVVFDQTQSSPRLGIAAQA